MNQLSWLLYLADVSGNLSTIFFYFGVLAAIGILIFAIICLACADMGENPPVKGFIYLVPVCFILFVFASVLPSKNTVYAIAASQIGEQVAKTPLALKAEKALESWLDKQTAGK